MHSASLAIALLAGSLSMVSGQSIDPNSVPIATRQQWCNSQLAACPLLCLQITPTASTESNSCDTATLTYSCVCENGLQPNVSEYSQTLPYFLCTEQNNNCVANCAQGDSACQTACRTNNPCGAQNPTRVNTTSSAAATATKTGGSAASTDASTTVYTGFGGSASTGSASSSSSSSSAAANLLNLGQMYGLGVVATGLFAGFSLLL